MFDNRRNRKYSKQKEREKRDDQLIQPKILLKPKEKDYSATVLSPATQNQSQISIAIRDIESKPIQSVNNIIIQTKDKDNYNSTSQLLPTIATIQTCNTSKSVETFFQPMTRPITVISYSSNLVNLNITRVLQKTNTDFLVVGVIGEQNVGKSTILNILATETTNNFDIKNNIFDKKNGVFRVNIKPSKGPSLPRTESLHMFITDDRMILLDLPPVLCNPSKKDGTSNEIDDIKNIILLLTICHLVIVVQDDYFNLNLIRLLQFAELSKPVHDIKTSFVTDYFPNILFIKNKAKRIDFLPANIEKNEQMLKYFFKDSNLKIYFAETEHQKRKVNETVNYFLFPEISEKDNELCLYYPSLNVLAEELKSHVLMTPRNQIYNCNNELNEAIWFELLTVTAMGKNDFFLTTYEDTRRCQTHTNNDQIIKNSGLNLIDVIEQS